MPPKGSDFDREMAQLEAEIKRLEAEYNQFFAGRLQRLPWETRARVEKLVKRYDRMNLRNTGERFRFETVQARYVAFCDLWERNLKAKEEGRPQRGRPVAPPPPGPEQQPAAAAAARAAAPPNRMVHVAAIRDPAHDAEQLMNLYERLSQARKEIGEQPLEYKRFAAVIKAQVNKLGGGAADVAFRVDVKNGKVTMSATKKD